MHGCMHTMSLQSCPSFWDPMNCSLPGSSVHGILQARILERVAIPFSKESSQSRNRTCVSYNLLHWQVSSLPLSHHGSPHQPSKASTTQGHPVLPFFSPSTLLKPCKPSSVIWAGGAQLPPFPVGRTNGEKGLSDFDTRAEVSAVTFLASTFNVPRKHTQCGGTFLCCAVLSHSVVSDSL